MSIFFNPSPSSRSFGSNDPIHSSQITKSTNQDNAATDAPKEDEAIIGTVAQAVFKQTQTSESVTKLPKENLSNNPNLLPLEKTEGKIKISDEEFQAISNPARLSKAEVEEFVSFLITNPMKYLDPEKPLCAQECTMELAKSYLSGDISLVSLLKEKVNILNLEFCNLKIIPKGISLLTKLTSLELGFNKLTVFPNEFAHLQKFTELRITISDEEFEAISNPANLSKAEAEAFISFLVTHLMKCLNPKSPTHSEKIAMEFAKRYLSGDITLVTLLKDKLNKLNLHFRKLEVLPKGMSLLQRLTMLELGFNKLTDLPEELAYLKKLRVIDLIDNELTSVPRVLYKDKTPNLIKIYLEDNYRIKELPISLKHTLYAPYPQSSRWVGA